VPGHRARVAEREVDVLVSVDVGHATSAGAVEIQREVARRLVHPRHRHATEQVALSARVRLGGSGVGVGVASPLLPEQEREALSIDHAGEGWQHRPV
jgi:hypothetical protein